MTINKESVQNLPSNCPDIRHILSRGIRSSPALYGRRLQLARERLTF
jgi:hypothetical protein